MADESTPGASGPPQDGRRGPAPPPPEEVQEGDREPPPSSVDPEIVEHIRQEDIEPYTGLRWVGTLFKAAAVFLLVALVGEFIAGLRAVGWTSLPTLLGETARTFVFMVVLWGAGDLVRLLVAVGHDIRAQRIFLTRLEWRSRQPSGGRDVEGDATREPGPSGPGVAGAVAAGRGPRGGARAGVQPETQGEAPAAESSGRGAATR